jgi:hypothetical protein
MMSRSMRFARFLPHAFLSPASWTLAVVVYAIVLLPASARATPPGANGKIAYSCGITDPQTSQIVFQICSINPDGTGFAQLTFLAPGEGSNHALAWSPDGTKIAFAAGLNTVALGLDIPTSNLWVMNADGSNLTQLTASSADTQPTWSPDGTKIAFTSFRNDTNLFGDNILTAQVFVMNADGSNQEPITFPNSAAFDSQPAWSPDGGRIAFVHYGFDGAGVDGGYGEIWTVNPDGSGLAQLTAEPSLDPNPITKDRPSWSPDGTRIAFTSEVCCGSSPVALNPIWTVNADGSGEQPVTNNPNVYAFDAAWSPDGTKFVFTCSAEDGSTPFNICVSNADGTDIVHITGTRVDFSDWQPLPTSRDVTVTDCSDPSLAQLTSVDGSLTISNIPGCTAVNLGSLVSVGANLDITGAGITTINLGSLATTGSNLDISAGSVDVVNLGNVNAVGANLDLGVGSVDVVNLGNLNTVGANLDISAGSVNIVNLGNLTSVGGNLQFQSGGETTLNLASTTTVGGNLTLLQGGDVDAPGVAADGNTTVTSKGGNTVSAQTGGGATDVSILGGPVAMHVVVPQGAFDRSVTFTITRQPDSLPEPGTADGGSLAEIDPLGSYHFSFAIPTLNAEAQLAFLIDLSALDEATRAALLDGVQANRATIAVKEDALGSTYQAFPLCQDAQTPLLNSCVVITLLDAAGSIAVNPAAAAFVNFSGVAGHFSTYAPVLVSKVPAVSWSDPASIVYGVPLGATQLNATVPVSGRFAYTPAAGVVLPAGLQTLSVTFTPDSPAYTSATTSVRINVQAANTTVSLKSSGSPSGAGLAVTFTATVAPVAPGAGTPTGIVTFSDGATLLGSASLSGGAASLTTAALQSAGTHIISARYGADGNFLPSGQTMNQSVVTPTVQIVATATFGKNPQGDYIATITLKNVGLASAGGVHASALLNGAAGTPGDTALGSLSSGKSSEFIETFGRNAGRAGSGNTLRVQIGWTTGSATASLRVTLP